MPQNFGNVGIEFNRKNVALWKSTDQSTTYSANGINFTSDKAVDGNGDGNFDSHTCTHTKPGNYNPTWNVYLGNAYYIIAIKIKNRNDYREYLF
uniref:Fucolectin n=1 Tax=Magallana gigas TaxID=29159 RepID=K1RJG5_MAGGI